MPLVLTIVAALRRSSGRYLPRLREERQQVVDVVGGDLLLEALGHERLLGGGHLVDVFAQDDLPLALGVDQLDGRLGLGSEQPVDHAAVVGGDGVLDEVALDAAAGVEDVGQELDRGAGRPMPVKSGPTWPPSCRAVALGALFLEDHLAARRRRRLP